MAWDSQAGGGGVGSIIFAGREGILCVLRGEIGGLVLSGMQCQQSSCRAMSRV